MANYDVVVIGCGGVGSATLVHLARRGLRVLGIDRFAPPHDRGSSHGRTRMIRQAYFEHPDYVPLVLRAYELWAELEAAAGETLYRETGLLQIGPPDGEVVPGVMASAKQHRLDVEHLNADEIRRRYPQFQTSADMVAAWERRAGFLHVERCVRAQLSQAETAGATILGNTAVRAWNASPDAAEIETDAGIFSAARIVVTAGAWAQSLLSDLGVPLRVIRKPQYWFAPADDRYRADQGCPSFLYETLDADRRTAGVFYGFPVVGPEGLKCAEHSGGVELTDPSRQTPDVDDADFSRVRTFLAKHLPGVTPSLTDHAPCLYTMSPDANFIVDRHPRHPQISFAAGLSGHGFKFTSVLGEVLADLSTAGTTSLPIGFLSVSRFNSLPSKTQS